MSVVSGVVALAFAIMGVWALSAPMMVTRQFGITDLSAQGRSEVRAVYGGFGLAMAAMLLVFSGSGSVGRGVSLTVAAALGGMAVGRVISLAVDRRIGRMPSVYLAIEAVAAGTLFFLG